MRLPTLAEMRQAQSLIDRHMQPTPQCSWPLLNQRLDAEIWVKHENHTPVGAFKLRGALVYIDWLKTTQPDLTGVVAATRGNFGQGVALAARALGLKATIVVPHGNNPDQNRAIHSQGAELIENGHDFQASLEYARGLAAQRKLAFIDSFHERLVWGTATYALELFEHAPPLDRLYVPIGLGSSICGAVAAREALKLQTEIIGVTAAASPAYARSFSEHRLIEAPALTKIADGQACRTPNQEALEAILANVSRIVEVTDEEIAEAMNVYFEDTHNLAEGAGASSLAAAMKEKDKLHDSRSGVVLTGGNIDRERYLAVLGQQSSALVPQ